MVICTLLTPPKVHFFPKHALLSVNALVHKSKLVVKKMFFQDAKLTCARLFQFYFEPSEPFSS